MFCRTTRLFCFGLFVKLICLGAALQAAEGDLLIADFEGTDYDGWQVEGEAFGSGPARGTLPKEPTRPKPRLATHRAKPRRSSSLPGK